MATKIVFVGGTDIEVETPIQNLVRLFDEAERSGVSFAPPVDSSMRCFVNREQILYLEAVPAQEEKPFWVNAKPTTTPETTLKGFSAARAAGST